MDRDYQPLPIRELGANAGFRRPMPPPAARVTLESPAAQVMTDLAGCAPATIRAQAPLAGANQFMITRGVISATDILSERPMRVAIERGLRRDELTVADVMTPAAQVEVIAFEEVEGARVGHVLETLRRAGRQHALAVEHHGRAMVRGVFSLSQIARQLGVAVQTGGEVARTFSEIESAIK